MKVIKGGAPIRLLVVALALVALTSHDSLVTGAEVSLSQCREQRQKCVNECKSVVFGRAPSAACCQIVRAIKFECMCPVIDSKLAALLTLRRAIKFSGTAKEPSLTDLSVAVYIFLEIPEASIAARLAVYVTLSQIDGRAFVIYPKTEIMTNHKKMTKIREWKTFAQKTP